MRGYLVANVSDVIIRITTEDKASQKQLKDLLKTFAAITAGAVAAGYAMKKAFEFSREGAAIRQTHESFELLLDKVELAPDLLQKLKTAARGTIPDMKLMSSTATLLAGAHGELGKALGNATPKLLEIAKAANKLNPSLGDTTFMYDSLARGIKRASPLILDNLGLVIKVEEGQRRYAESIGKTIDQLTVEEQKLALLNDVLEQGDILIEQVGGNTEATTDIYDQFTAALENYIDAVKTSTIVTADGTVVLADNLNEAAKAEYIMQGYRAAVEQGIVTQIEYSTVLSEYKDGLIDVNKFEKLLLDRQEEHRKKIEEFNRVLGDHKDRLYDLSYRYIDLSDQVDFATQSTEEHLHSILGYIPEVAEASRVTEEWQAHVEELHEEQGDALEALRNTTQGVYDYYEAVSDARRLSSPIRAFIDDLKWLQAGGGPAFDVALDTIKRKLAEKKITEEEAQAFSENLFIAFEQSLADAGIQSKDDAAQNIADALGIPIEDALLLLGEFNTGLDRLTDLQKTITITLALDDPHGLRSLIDGGVTIPITPVVTPPAGGGGGGDGGIFQDPDLPPGKGPLSLIPSILAGNLPRLPGGPIDLPRGWAGMEADQMGGLLGSLSGLGSAAARMLRSRTIDPLRDSIRGMDSAINELLDSMGYRTIDEAISAGGMAGFWAPSTELTELLQLDKDRANAMAEYEEHQRTIVELQRQQENMAFLQQQIKLLDMITEYGLDPSLILGGTQLGIGADPTAIIAAMVAAMQAVLGQLGSEYNLTINTNAPFENIIEDYEWMESMAGI
jgi:iron-sulfur cluster repair protein YtfE (RIC family)